MRRNADEGNGLEVKPSSAASKFSTQFAKRRIV
jgi:hypothetical protein